ncbi:MAG: endonuclease MutS2 [Brevinematales bacterium]|nr:endonuclease MutS2 [Brevinematales bacterium]
MKTYDEILEFEVVLEIIKSNLKTNSSVKIVSNLKQFDDKIKLKNEFDLIRETIEFIKYDGKFYFEEAKDIEKSINMSSIENYYLSIEELLEIQKYLIIYKGIIDTFIEYSAKYPLLSKIIEKEIFPSDLYKIFNNTFETDGTIKDNATPELSKIRKRKQSLKDEIQKKCNAIFQNPDLSDCFQERIITFKDGRFVIPVKSSFKSKIKSKTNAILHSFSNSRETVYIEPEILFYLNEEIMEIDEEETKEIERILGEITNKINENSENIKEIYKRVGIIEWLTVRANYAIKNKCNFPLIVDEPIIKLVEARHPLLFDKAVPLTVELGKNYKGLIVSGPNAGGKTVLIKTVGLLLKMALAGIPIPAKETSVIGFFSKIMAEIGDEQSISNNLSSFSGHIVALSKIIKDADSNSVVLIDEIASSTEPKEGEAIAYGVIKKLIEQRVLFIITTHYQGLKQIALIDNQVMNASMEFDEENFTPLYKLQIGKYGKSYALTIAKKYGLPIDIIKNAEEYLNSIQTDFDRKMIEFEKQSNELFKKKKIIEENLIKTKRLKEEYEKVKTEFEKEKDRIKSEHFKNLKEEYDELLKEISILKNEIKEKKIENRKNIEEKISNISNFIEQEEKRFVDKERKKAENLSVGDKVYVAKYGKDGYIEQITNDKIKVRIGILSLFIEKDELFATEDKKEQKQKIVNYKNEAPPFVLDLRGMKAEEAIKILEKNIDKAIISGTNIMEILHGKGEGVLRKLVHEYLKKLKEVERFDYARPEEGGQGKTIVIFK